MGLVVSRWSSGFGELEGEASSSSKGMVISFSELSESMRKKVEEKIWIKMFKALRKIGNFLPTPQK